MKKLKILNAYSGIGGNRRLWGDTHSITAVELDTAIAAAYQSRYPCDKVVVCDAKQYILDHYREFDLVWVSPPCQPHSSFIFSNYKKKAYKANYPDMSLYEIILFLQLHMKDKRWVVENVIPYYTPLIKPSATIDRHHYWSNFKISEIQIEKKYIVKDVTKKDSPFNLDGFGIKDQRQAIRNQVDGDVGAHILDCAIGTVQHKQGGLF